jgi:hypothetical protein
MGKNQIVPAIERDQTIAGGQIFANGPFLV